MIYPIHIDNIYIISPDADLSKSAWAHSSSSARLVVLFSREGSLSKLYRKTFRETANYRTLQEALAEYSDAISLYDHLARNDDPDLTVRSSLFFDLFWTTCDDAISARSSAMCGMVPSSSSSRSGALLLLSCFIQRRSERFQKRIPTGSNPWSTTNLCEESVGTAEPM